MLWASGEAPKGLTVSCVLGVYLGLLQKNIWLKWLSTRAFSKGLSHFFLLSRRQIQVYFAFLVSSWVYAFVRVQSNFHKWLASSYSGRLLVLLSLCGGFWWTLLQTPQEFQCFLKNILNDVYYTPAPPKESFLEVFSYIKPTKRHSFEGPGTHMFHRCNYRNILLNHPEATGNTPCVLESTYVCTKRRTEHATVEHHQRQLYKEAVTKHQLIDYPPVHPRSWEIIPWSLSGLLNDSRLEEALEHCPHLEALSPSWKLELRCCFWVELPLELIVIL